MYYLIIIPLFSESISSHLQTESEIAETTLADPGAWNVGFILFFYLGTGSKFTIFANSIRAPMQETRVRALFERAKQISAVTIIIIQRRRVRAHENKINEKQKQKNPLNLNRRRTVRVVA